MKIKFNMDYELLLNKMIEIPTTAIVVRAIFHENNEYNPKLFRWMSLLIMNNKNGILW